MATALGVPGLAQSVPGAVPCQDSIGIALIDVPSSRVSDPRARTYVIDHVDAGTTFTRRIRVCNGTSSPVPVQVYSGAAIIEGTAFKAVEGRVRNELSDWIRVEPAQVTIPAGGESVVAATFSVPAGAKAGERYAAVLVETPPVEQMGGISVASRVGVRVYLSVGGDKEPASDFLVESLQASRRSDGSPVVTAVVRNTGERALDLAGELQLSEGPGGLSAGPFPATVGTTLASGASGPVAVVLDKAISGGPWLATVTMRSGTMERRAEARLTFPDAAGQQEAAVRAKNLPLREDPSIVVPVAGGLIALIALLLLLMLVRRRTRDDEKEPVAPAAL